jgi:membrane-associated phospholipid phosphatase
MGRARRPTVPDGAVGLFVVEATDPVLGYPSVTLALYWIYFSWFIAISLIGTWQFISRGPAREQFLVSSAICWGAVGTLGAMSFASVGPIFYGRLLGGPDPFAELVAYIHATAASGPQDMLWAAFVENRLPEFGKGISAMPSLHVAIATLNALVAYRHARWLGIVFGIYAGLVALASVHLGWHYAIDAYAGAAVAGLIWWTVGLVLKPRMQMKPAE